MTLIIAHIDKKNDLGILSGDLRITKGKKKYTLKKSKVSRILISEEDRNCNALIGFCGSVSISQKLLKFINEYSKDKSTYPTLDIIAEKLNKYTNSPRLGIIEVLIVTENGNVYKIDYDGSIIETTEKYSFIGSGEELAKGILHHSYYFNKEKYSDILIEQTYYTTSHYTDTVSPECIIHKIKLL